MKPGCIFRLVLITVTAIGVGYYLFDHYGVVIYERSKEKIIEKLTSDITEKLKKETQTRLADDLSGRMSEFSEKLKTQAENVDLSEIYGIFNKVDEMLDSVKIDDQTYNKMNELLSLFEEKFD